ncbi:hypothetical protein D3C80_1259570 [compost metagenome]
MIGAWVVAASSVAIPVSAISSGTALPSSGQVAHSCPTTEPRAAPTNNVGVNTPPGAPEPLLASTANSLQIRMAPTSNTPGGALSSDCTTL